MCYRYYREIYLTYFFNQLILKIFKRRRRRGGEKSVSNEFSNRIIRGSLFITTLFFAEVLSPEASGWLASPELVKYNLQLPAG